MANVPDISTTDPAIELWSVPQGIQTGPIPFGQAMWYRTRSIPARGSGDTTEISATLTPPDEWAFRFVTLECSIQADSNGDVTNFSSSAWFLFQEKRPNPYTQEVNRAFEMQIGNAALDDVAAGVSSRGIWLPRSGTALSGIVRPDPTNSFIRLVDGSGGTTSAATFTLFACALLYHQEQIRHWAPNYWVPTL